MSDDEPTDARYWAHRARQSARCAIVFATIAVVLAIVSIVLSLT